MQVATNPLWFPYAQMKTMNTPRRIVSGQGVYLQQENGQALIDSISSWWCVIHGYSHPDLIRVATEQIQNLAHVAQGGLVNQPAEDLAKKLVDITPKGLNHVFFADSGSVAVDIAMKMAMQYWRNQGNSRKRYFATVRQAYHGETCGSMSLCDPDDGFLVIDKANKTDTDQGHTLSEHALFSGLVPPQYFLPKLDFGLSADPDKLAAAVGHIETLFKAKHEELVAFVIEPIMQGAGGMQLYDPKYLHELRTLCDAYDVLLIVDEVATGFGRTGTLFASEQAGIVPDIMCLGKALFAGFVGHAATMAKSKIFDAFYSDQAGKCFMHGTTFQANPLACAVGLESIRLFESQQYLNKIAAIESQLKNAFDGFTNPAIKEIRIKGALAVIEVYDNRIFERVPSVIDAHGVWLRPFENVLYTAPPYVISEAELDKVILAMKAVFIS